LLWLEKRLNLPSKTKASACGIWEVRFGDVPNAPYSSRYATVKVDIEFSKQLIMSEKNMQK
jgi:hypothetical protein